MSIEIDDGADATLAIRPGRLPYPSGAQAHRFDPIPTAVVIGYHLIALLALFPFFFSWTGVILLVVGDYVFGTLGINLGYHRLLAHRGFRSPKWFEHTLAVLGLCCIQDTPVRWIAVHRRHHQYADEQPDPHSPLVSFFWGHVGWVLVENRELARLGIYERYARDLLKDRFYKRLERGYWQFGIVFGSWLLFFAGGFIAEQIMGGTLLESVRFGASLLIWGVFVRTVAVWHQTWGVNSITHLWGYRNYETPESSHNHFLMGIAANGEGWHNNHHAYPRSARHGHEWWEIDVTYMILRGAAALGLATDIVLPNRLNGRVSDEKLRAQRNAEEDPG